MLRLKFKDLFLDYETMGPFTQTVKGSLQYSSKTPELCCFVSGFASLCGRSVTFLEALRLILQLFVVILCFFLEVLHLFLVILCLFVISLRLFVLVFCFFFSGHFF